ncbi:MAG: CPBP family intramembrane metalloprotease [Lachnospiraceae bacterium]|nr:CPBP family intramembrane metalloprotease [Lachnospiraceae bacterium]
MRPNEEKLEELILGNTNNTESKKTLFKKVGLFLVICLPITWILMAVSYKLTSDGKMEGLATVLLNLSMFMPAIAGVICVLKNKEGIGTLKLLPGLYKTGWVYLVAIFGGAALSLMAEPFVMLFFPEVEKVAGGAMPELLFNILLYIVIGVIGSFVTLGEEIGWMGYLYPKMEKLCGVIPALIATGLIRGLWHVVMFMQMDFKVGVVGFICLSLSNIFLGSALVLLTKLTNSVYPATIVHALSNVLPSVLMGYLVINEALYDKNYVAIQFVSLIPAVIVGAICAVILVKMSKKNLTE